MFRSKRMLIKQRGIRDTRGQMDGGLLQPKMKKGHTGRYEDGERKGQKSEKWGNYYQER